MKIMECPACGKAECPADNDSDVCRDCAKAGKKAAKSDLDAGCGCLIVCLGIAIIIGAFLHGCAAIIQSFR